MGPGVEGGDGVDGEYSAIGEVGSLGEVGVDDPKKSRRGTKLLMLCFRPAGAERRRGIGCGAGEPRVWGR